MIKAEGLTMHYGPVKALQDVSFSVGDGEIVALLGPNGAGKSTTMKILTTYLYPTAGTAEVNGVNVLENPIEARANLGYLPETLPLYMDMEVKGYLNFVGKARGLSGAKLKERTEMVLEETALTPMYRKVIRELSKGYKQRTALAQSLIHDPKVIILDEPTSGLDPHQILEIRELIRKLADGKTVLLSTHILQEVEASADRVVIISRGHLIADGTVAELKSDAAEHDRVRVGIKGNTSDIERALSGVSGASKVEALVEEDGYTTFSVLGKQDSKLWKHISDTARSNSWELKELTNQPLTLEETFLALTERAGKGGVV